mgnify:CR=1 FL=1
MPYSSFSSTVYFLTGAFLNVGTNFLNFLSFDDLLSGESIAGSSAAELKTYRSLGISSLLSSFYDFYFSLLRS